MTKSYLSDQREQDELLHPEEVRNKLKVGDKTLYRYRRDDVLHPVVLNSRTYRYRKSEINRLIQQADSSESDVKASHKKKRAVTPAKGTLAR
jgi:predicted site-specific integrase-resolvase